MNHHVTLTPSQRAWHEAAKAREADRAKKARRLALRTSSDFVSSAPIVTRPKPSPTWLKNPSHFDAHVWCWRAWIREQVDIAASPTRTYIRKRALDFGLSYAQMADRRRFQHIVPVKHLIMWEIKTQIDPEMSYPDLGRHFGGLDHTSVLYAVRKIQAMVDKGTLDAHLEKWHRIHGKTRAE